MHASVHHIILEPVLGVTHHSSWASIHEHLRSHKMDHPTSLRRRVWWTVKRAVCQQEVWAKLWLAKDLPCTSWHHALFHWFWWRHMAAVCLFTQFPDYSFRTGHEFFCAWIGVFQPSSWSQWLPKPWYECQVPMSPSLSWAKATKKCQSIVSQGAWGSLSRHVSAINTIGAHLSPRTYLGLMKKLIDTTRQKKKNESKPSGKKGPQRLPLLLSVELQCCPVIPMSWEAAPAFLMFRTPLAMQHSFATGGVSIFATSDHVQLWTRFDFGVHGNRRRHWLSCIPFWCFMSHNRRRVSVTDANLLSSETLRVQT